MRIVCLSDTHGFHDRIAVPPGDLLLHAGDFTMVGREDEIARFDAWLATLPHRRKVVIAGNHDWLFQLEPARARSLLAHAIYLEDSETTVEGLRIWGSPWQPEFARWAFNLPRGAPLASKWALTPSGIDLLLTHGPPRGFGDRTCGGESVGCEDLLAALRRLRPRAHVFGHIHEGYGTWRDGETTLINAAVCDEAYYAPAHAPVVLDW
ncbi:MAG: metallophosphatase domain-containing protein [Planctomycetes bacterium]|nr:metallophosphatase domain-containing protein [Planctomycetota bacterium]